MGGLRVEGSFSREGEKNDVVGRLGEGGGSKEKERKKTVSFSSPSLLSRSLVPPFSDGLTTQSASPFNDSTTEGTKAVNSPSPIFLVAPPCSKNPTKVAAWKLTSVR